MKINKEKKELILLALNTKMAVIQDQIDNLYKIGGAENLEQRKKLVRKFVKYNHLLIEFGGFGWTKESFNRVHQGGGWS
jgi:hypothetical protein